MEADLVVLTKGQHFSDVRFAGLICIRAGVVSVHLGKSATAPALVLPFVPDQRDVWTPAGAVLPLPDLFVNVNGGEFAVLLERPAVDPRGTSL